MTYPHRHDSIGCICDCVRGWEWENRRLDRICRNAHASHCWTTLRRHFPQLREAFENLDKGDRFNRDYFMLLWEECNFVVSFRI